MSHSRTVGALTEELVAALTNKTDKSSIAFRRLKHSADKTLRSHRNLRTDQFAVKNVLDGLDEKFRVLSNDALADALQQRVNELEEHAHKLMPDFLGFLLELSDNPAVNVDLEKVNFWQAPKSPEKLTWADFDPLDGDDDLWKEPDFAGGSSEEEYMSNDEDDRTTTTRQRDSPIEDEALADEGMVTTEAEPPELQVERIQGSQFWLESKESAGEVQGEGATEITELQALREVIFLLEGLPTSLFWRIGDTIQLDRTFRLNHTSWTSYWKLMQSFIELAQKLDLTRSFVKKKQSVRHLQTFQVGIEELLAQVGKDLSAFELSYIRPQAPTTVSLLDLKDVITRESSLLLSISDAISQFETQTDGQNFRYLEFLFDLSCSCQAEGKLADFRRTVDLFTKCFQSYIKPLQLWMQTGTLSKGDTDSPISSTETKGELGDLWSAWYSLDESHDDAHAPRFIKPALKKIFITGKSVIFLKQLGVDITAMTDQDPTISYDELLTSDAALFLPFSAIVETKLDQFIDKSHSTVTQRLRQELEKHGGLPQAFEALSQIFFATSMASTSIIDNQLFERLDRGVETWSDRFLLTEIIRGAFANNSCIDPSRLLARTVQTTRSKGPQSRTIKSLVAFKIDYILPWPVANIITKTAISTYQRISTFLFQIRRAKNIVERLQVLNVMHNNPDHDSASNERNYLLSLALRQRLIWFYNTLYAHLMDLVLLPETARMRTAMREAQDIDAMIEVHDTYTKKLEEQCLLSKNIAPIYQAIISLLDLSIAFEDVQSEKSGPETINTTQSSRKRRRRQSSFSSSDEDEDKDEDAGNTTLLIIPGESHSERLANLRGKYEKHIHFVTAGLRGVGRVGGRDLVMGKKWDLLAGDLAWGAGKIGHGGDALF